MTVHNKLIINSHLKDIFIVVCKNLSALTRLSTYLEINQKKKKNCCRIWSSEFGHCPTIWVFILNKLTGNVHERYQRTINEEKMKIMKDW